MSHSWTNLIRTWGRHIFVVMAVALIFLAPARINCLQLGSSATMDVARIDVPAVIDGGSFHNHDGSSDVRDPDGCGMCHCSIVSAIQPEGGLVLPVPLICTCRPSLPLDVHADDWSFAPEPPPNLV